MFCSCSLSVDDFAHRFLGASGEILTENPLGKSNVILDGLANILFAKCPTRDAVFIQLDFAA